MIAMARLVSFSGTSGIGGWDSSKPVMGASHSPMGAT